MSASKQKSDHSPGTEPTRTTYPAGAAALLHRSRFRGWMFKVVGVLLLVVALAGGIAIKSGRLGVLWGALLGGLSGGIGVIGSMLFVRGKQHLTHSAGEQLASDTRAPVIYLRSFAADSKTAEAEAGNQLGVGWATEEEQLAAVLNQVGPVIAVGRPNEDLPKVGAARLYVADEEWQARVKELLGRARLVVLRLGASQGLLWELRSVLEAKAPGEVLLLVPSAEEAYDEFRQNTTDILPHPLPRLMSWKVVGKRSMRALIGFDEDWVPVLQDLPLVRGSVFRNQVGRGLQSTLQYAVQPFFERLGVPWRRPSVGRVWYFLGAIPVIIVVLFLVAFITQQRSTSHWEPYVGDIPRNDVPGSQPGVSDPNPPASRGTAERSRGATNSGQRDEVELTRRGLRRLGDKDLVDRLRLLDKLYASMTDEECVAFESGKMGDAEREDVFQRLVEWDFNRLAGILFSARKAEVDDNPPSRTISAESRELAVKALLGRFDPNESSLLDALEHQELASHANLARAIRRYYAHALELADEPRRAIALIDVLPLEDER